MIQVSCLRALMLLPFDISDMHLRRKLLYFFPASVITKIDMYLTLIRIIHMDAAIDRPVQNLDRFIVGRDQYIHLRIVFRLYLREFRIFDITHIKVMYKCF